MKSKDAINRRCPWSGKPVQDDSLTCYKGVIIGFCNPGCRDKFEIASAHYPEVIALLENK